MSVSKHDHVYHMKWGDKWAKCSECNQTWALTPGGWVAKGQTRSRPRPKGKGTPKKRTRIPRKKTT